MSANGKAVRVKNPMLTPGDLSAFIRSGTGMWFKCDSGNGNSVYVTYRAASVFVIYPADQSGDMLRYDLDSPSSVQPYVKAILQRLGSAGPISTIEDPQLMRPLADALAMNGASDPYRLMADHFINCGSSGVTRKRQWPMGTDLSTPGPGESEALAALLSGDSASPIGPAPATQDAEIPGAATSRVDSGAPHLSAPRRLPETYVASLMS